MVATTKPAAITAVKKVLKMKFLEAPMKAVAIVAALSSSAQAASDACDPNYDPCVPVASDVDCASGRGNGPAYVQGPVRVIGTDIYGLDRDHDGIGCE